MRWSSCPRFVRCCRRPGSSRQSAISVSTAASSFPCSSSAGGWRSSGPIADRFGRVRVLMLAILCYSLFTFLGALAQNWWQLAIFRLLAGFGIGGEFVGAATFVVEELPERRRVMGTGIMNSGYYVGIFIAAALNYLIGAHYGWRAMFAIGGLPALFIAYVRLHVQEPERWRQRVAETGGWRARDSFFALFSPEYRRRTLLNCVFLLISMIGLWAGSVYAPTAVTQVATRMGYNAADAARIASRATMLLATGTIIGCLVMPTLAHRFGRRGALACFYSLMAVSIAFSFGYAFYRTSDALITFVGCLFLSAWAEAASLCTGPGSASSTAPNVEAVRWLSRRRSADSSPPARLSSWGSGFSNTAVSACRWR